MMKQTTCYGCDKPIEPEWLPVGEFIVCDECSSSTDKLSVKKLQEQQHELRILRDENRKLRNSLEMGRKDEERYRSALAEIMRLSSLSPMINDIARKVLAGLDIEGGCPVGPIGVNGLTKEELEGSDDE